MRRFLSVRVIALAALVGCDGYIEAPHGEGSPEAAPDHAARCSEERVGPPLLRRLTADELRATIEAALPELGPLPEDIGLGADPVAESGFANDADMLVVGAQAARELQSTAETVAALAADAETLATLLPCASSGQDECAQTFVEDVGARLFRRPLAEDERQRYVDLASSIRAQADFATAIKWTLVALLQSPHFAYRSELGQAANGQRVLGRWELASALSYNYTGGPPDEELRQLAERGELEEPEVRLAQARRLLRTPAGRAKVLEFFRGWSGYQHVLETTKNSAPNFSNVRAAMVSETERFIEKVVFEDGGGVRELLTSNVTSLDRELAGFYGYGGAFEGTAVVERPPEWGVGLLAQGSMLAGRAHENASSPTLRGLVVYERLQCQPKMVVPANIPNIGPPEPGQVTTRQRYEEVHAAAPACNFCHQFFDPIGFAFEHFDETGRYRADEGGLPIDARGELVDEDRNLVFEFDGPTELSHALADAPRTTDCVSGLAAAWAFGGAGGEVCTAESARESLLNGEIGVLEFLAQLAVAPHFATRTQ